ncbi:MAG: dNTP triphosphohydrolase [Planctomycetes bacterium]|nr:dNTP triphosphohydrolase [Planctomycetota bacterium]
MMSDGLSPYAVTEAVSQGRVFPEPPHAYRSDFERDRDRIIHCSAFRRLEGKTQVFSPGVNDYYRSRLTHTIEVAQIGRTIAKVLGLNESLTEAICLAHDLGHPPFGHTGEEVLNDLMADCGGFEHNAQTLRIVTLLEHPYPGFMGLNLMYETRLGLARKAVAAAKRKGRAIADCGLRIADSGTGANHESFDPVNCTLEGQAADVADRIAYNCHDLEDGMRARLIDGNQMRHLDLYAEAARRVAVERIPDWTIRRTRVAKTIIDHLVSDCIGQSRENIARAGVRTAREVCDRAEDLIALSAQYDRWLADLEQFLLRNLYHHERLLESAANVRRWLPELFGQLCREPGRMPGYFRGFIPDYGLPRAVCDYIAGMTDRYCLKLLGVPNS